MKTTELNKMRSAHLPFGDWYYFPRKSLNIVKLAHNPNALWKPVHLSIALTSRCEKNCDFCYAESDQDGETLWKLENVVKMVESCDQNGVFAVTLGGGEPILWNDRSAKADFYDLLNELSSFGCDVSFTTSAVPMVDWTKIPHTILPRISLHHHREFGFVNNEIKIVLSHFEYREILDALPFLNRLECHSRIKYETKSFKQAPYIVFKKRTFVILQYYQLIKT